MSNFELDALDFNDFPVMRNPQPARLRTGIDVVQISRIRESLDSFGDRFSQRLFSSEEIAYASSDAALAAERFAARFAAKEAAIKAFGLSHVGIDWREIEVHRRTDGDCCLRLHGRAALHARHPRDEDVALSLSHAGDYAVAIVTASNVPNPSDFQHPSQHDL
jgi:holo-[acyl-carrier protein] synthase